VSTLEGGSLSAHQAYTLRYMNVVQTHVFASQGSLSHSLCVHCAKSQGMMDGRRPATNFDISRLSHTCRRCFRTLTQSNCFSIDFNARQTRIKSRTCGMVLFYRNSSVKTSQSMDRHKTIHMGSSRLMYLLH